MGKDFRAKIVDEPLTNAGREPATNNIHHGINESESANYQCQRCDKFCIFWNYAVIDEFTKKEWSRDDEKGIDDNCCKKEGEIGAIWVGIAQDPFDGTRLKLLFLDRRIGSN